MIKFVRGDLFSGNFDIIVNTVNCVGVMGKGVALEFKKRFPQMFDDYRKRCGAGEIKPGIPYEYLENNLISNKISIINFPTKNDWRKSSEYKYIEDGLFWMHEYLSNKKGVKVGLPALGCGNGGLDWSIVREMIQRSLSDLDADIHVFEPNDFNERSYVNNSNLNKRIGFLDKNEDGFPINNSLLGAEKFYFFPSEVHSFKYRWNLIVSTIPDDAEKSKVKDFVQNNISKNDSLLLGGSSFDKKFSIELMKSGYDITLFIPSGIDFVVNKYEKTNSDFNLKILSIGDPFEKFSKKYFMPSILSRILISEKNIIFSENKSWIKKYENYLKDKSIFTC